MKRFILTLLLVPFIAGCALFFDPGGDGDLRFAKTDESVYRMVERNSIVDGCFLDVTFNPYGEHYSFTVFQNDFPRCDRPFTYLIYPEGAINYTSQTPVFGTVLEPYQTFSWLVYINYNRYFVDVVVDGVSHRLAVIERFDVN